MTISNEIKGKIVDEMAEELDKREYYFERCNLEEIVEECFEQKKDLIDVLSKHPNWNQEKLMIQFDTDMERKINTYEVCEFSDWLRWNAPIEYSTKEYEVYLFISKIETQFFNEDMADDINRMNAINDSFKLRTNMKSSKAIGKICREMGWDKLPEYNRKYAALCDSLSPLKITRHTVISVNPMDYLLMSNGNSWHSCHDIGEYGDSGCYSSGTISYMLDKHSFVFYTVDASYNGNNIELQPKIQRQMFGYNDEVLVQLRLYPQDNDYGAGSVYDNIRAIVQTVIAKCLDKPNLWIKTTKDVEEVVSHGSGATCYPDWQGDNPGSTHCSVSTLKERAKGKESRHIVFGAQPICIACGCRHSYTESIDCCSDDCEICEDCGRRIDRDDVYWYNGEPYCEECVTLCEECDEYYPNDMVREIDGYPVCDSCIADKDYYRCENCGELHHIDYTTITEDGHIFCDDCADDLVYYCEECGCSYRKEDLHYDEKTDRLYCDDCYESLLEEREEKEPA